MTITSASVGSEIFLENQFFSLGINAYGGLGSTHYAPTGIATDTVNHIPSVGLFVDLDGFGTGKQTPLHDAIMRGAPLEGFNIGYKIGGTTHIESNQQLDGLTEIEGSAADKSTSSAAKALWSGSTDDKLAVSQTMTLLDGAKYIKVDVTLTNRSSASMTDLRYMRTADPDQGATATTTNKIVSQGDGEALVTAAADAKGSTPYFLYAHDARAVVSTYGFINEDPYAAAAHDAPQAVGYTVTKDQSINLTFTLGTLAVGQSTTLTFYMGVTDDVAATIKAINAGEATSPSLPPVDPAPTPPHAVDDAIAAVAGSTVTGNVLANDSDAAQRALSASLKTGPSHGSLKLNSDGSYTYAADKGYAGTDSFTYAATAGGQSDTATVKIITTAPAPSATDDAFAAVGGQPVTGNVLANDSDSGGFTLTAALVSGPAHGSLSLSADGSFRYVATAGYVGTDSFTYSATGGGVSDSATVRIIAAAPVPTSGAPDLPASPTLQRAGTLNGSASSADVLSGVSGANSFFFDLGASSGKDRITNFGSKDVLVTQGSLSDGNHDGKIMFSTGTTLKLDGTDTVTIDGVTGLRLLGSDSAGLHVYGDLTTRPADAIEGTLGNDRLSGGAGDRAADKFFVDTALNLNLGNDEITSFGSKDMLITTTALSSGKPGSSVSLSSGTISLGGGLLGSLHLTNASGANVTALDFAGTGVHDGVTYYIYGTHGSGVTVGSAGMTSIAAEAPALADTPALAGATAAMARTGTVVDGSAASSDTLSGTGTTTFFFDLNSSNGNDHITSLGAADLLVTRGTLADGNGNGTVSLSKHALLKLNDSDKLTIDGVAGLRLLGTDSAGMQVYGDLSVRPDRATEGTLGNDQWSGDPLDKKTSKFFFDTALGLTLGNDTIANFGTNDVLVSTTSLGGSHAGDSVAFSSDGLKLVSGNGADVGTVALTDPTGGAVTALEFDGTVEHGSVTYFVYSMPHSAVGTSALGL